MKKSLLALLFAVALAVPAMAENMWVGGSLGYENNSGGDYDANSFTIAPEFGYSLSDKWDIGLDLSYTSGKNDVDVYWGISDVYESYERSTYGIAPFARYHIGKVAGVDVMLKGSLFYNSTTIKDFDPADGDATVNSYGIAIAPVISYSINEKWSIGATLDFLSLGYSHSSSSDLKNDSGDDYSRDEFGFNLNDGSLISIGFSYHF